MRELTLRIRFTSPSLGNVKQRKGKGKYLLPRHPGTGRITFLSAWHQSNLKTASKILNRHHTHVKNVLWDIFVDGEPPSGGEKWYRRYYSAGSGKRRYSEHECFPIGHVVGLNAAVPSEISEDDMIELMNVAGRYCGLSPWQPTEYGHFEVESIRPRRSQVDRGPGPVRKVKELFR